MEFKKSFLRINTDASPRNNKAFLNLSVNKVANDSSSKSRQNHETRFTSPLTRLTYSCSSLSTNDNLSINSEGNFDTLRESDKYRIEAESHAQNEAITNHTSRSKKRKKRKKKNSNSIIMKNIVSLRKPRVSSPVELTKSEDEKLHGIGHSKYGHEALAQKIEEANQRRVACKNGASMFMSFKNQSTQHQNSLDNELKKIIDSPLMKTNLSEIARMSHQQKMAILTEKRESMFAESNSLSNAAKSLNETETSPLIHRQLYTPPTTKLSPISSLNNSSLNSTIAWDPTPATPSALNEDVVDIAAVVGLPPRPGTLKRMTTHPSLLPKHDFGTPTTQAIKEFQNWNNSHNRSSSQDSSQSMLQKHSGYRTTPIKQKVDTRSKEELMRISPLLALKKAIESSPEINNNSRPTLPDFTLKELDKTSLEISFDINESKQKMKKLIKERDISMQERMKKLHELQAWMASPKKRKSTTDLHQFSLKNTYGQYSTFLKLLQAEKHDLDKNLINQLKHKEMTRPKKYIQQCLNVNTKSVSWNQMVNEMHHHVNVQAKRARDSERRKARKMWFNNFVARIYNPERPHSDASKKVLILFQDFIDLDEEINQKNFFKLLDKIPDYTLVRMEVQKIVATMAQGFSVQEKAFLYYLHQRDIPFELPCTDEGSRMSYIFDSATVNYDAIFSDKNEPALNFQYPPQKFQVTETDST